MQIVNGKWQDDQGEPVTVFNYNKIQEIASNVTNVFGEDVTYSRIALMSAIKTLTPKQELDLVYVLNQEGAISKLAGY